MTDIVVRLRFWGDSYHLHKESADEIERLRAELATLKSQLEERGKEIDRLFDEIMYLEAGENI